jgi:hypothetical protein
VASHLANANLGSLPVGANALSPAEILGDDTCKGNPVAMAADRIGGTAVARQPCAPQCPSDSRPIG